MEAIYFSEGRLTKNGTNPYQFEYTIKDHLGNARVSFSDLNGNNTVDVPTEVLQDEGYYPFGLQQSPLGAVTGTQNKYQYRDKEFDDELGLNECDYGSRMYNPETSRWETLDPKAEAYVDMSCYNYVANNPIRNIDPNGEGVLDFMSGIASEAWNMTKNAVINSVNPIQKVKTLLSLVKASIHPINTGKAIVKDNKDKWNSGDKGKGKVVFGVVLLLIPGEGEGAAAEEGAAATEEAAAATEESAAAEETGTPEEKTSSKYEDETSTNKSVTNKRTDVTKDKFEKNLEESGYKKTTVDDGKATKFTKDGKSYTTRNNSSGNPTADFRKVATSKKADIKIRLGKK